jgi:DNA-binding transcriptional ArsR family regulator
MKIDPALVPVVAARFRALGDAGRLAILQELQSGEKTVSDLVRATGRSQPNVSQHAAALARAGFIAARREANRVFYRISDPYVARICEAVCNGASGRFTRTRRKGRTR